MGASDFQLGYQAYFRDEPFDATRTAQWQKGWETAEDEDLYGEGYDEDMDYGE